MATTKKPKKKNRMDYDLFAANQPHEVRYYRKKYPLIPKEVIAEKAKKAGRGRRSIDALLLNWMYKEIYSKILE